MFKQLEIHLTAPICECSESNLGWYVSKDKKGLSTLHITCKTCDTELIVGREHFKASFQLDKPYPGKRSDKPKKEVVGDLIKVDFKKEDTEK